MQLGEQFGPFLIDRELGAGAMGTVYRGKYKDGSLVAIKTMAPGYGSTNAAAADRFQREVDILKQLKHPNIVRLFGFGKHQKTRYFAMEYVEGESLDKVMARRGRMSWEEVVDLGTQLCAALQHAHEHGIVHRDLKPSNLMILPDGTLKLTDFGIAKDIDESNLTSTNCTVGTAAYMSPEQCRGERSISSKSDLYSLGIVFYELITGRKPFVAESPMEMFMLHVNTPPDRPIRLVLDLPVWMDNLICQLLEKKPEHRPLDAAMVGKALNSIQEKVEAQHSAGVDAVTARGGDRGRRGTTSEEDREAARALKGKKGRKKKGKKTVHERVWVRAVGLGLILAAVVTGIVLLLQPPSPDSLYRKAERLMKTNNPDRHSEAIDGPIREYLARYGRLDDPKTAQVRRWQEDYEVAYFEGLIDKHLRRHKGRGGLAVGANSEAQKTMFKAAVLESEGDRDEAMKLWKELGAAEGESILGVLAKRHLAALAGIDDEMKRMDGMQREVRNYRTEPDLDELQRIAFAAHRTEKLGDRAGARATYERLHDAASKEPVNRYWQLVAAVKLKQLKDGLKAKPQDDKARLILVRGMVETAEKEKRARMLDSRLAAHEVAMLYAKDADFADSVKRARALVEEIDTIQGKPAER